VTAVACLPADLEDAGTEPVRRPRRPSPETVRLRRRRRALQRLRRHHRPPLAAGTAPELAPVTCSTGPGYDGLLELLVAVRAAGLSQGAKLWAWVCRGCGRWHVARRPPWGPG
jgi:hypothetical protein